MASLLPSLVIATVLVVGFWVARRSNSSLRLKPPLETPTNLSLVSEKLVAALPHSVLLPHDGEAFGKSINSYWAQQEREVVQECIVQPRDIAELAKAMTILKQEYDERSTQQWKKSDDVLFAVRGGGQSPVPGGASAKGGVLIDLTMFREVTVSDDRESVVLGAGARWVDVSRVLDEMDLIVVGGRSSDVGVAGYTLGGEHTLSASEFPIDGF